MKRQMAMDMEIASNAPRISNGLPLLYDPSTLAQQTQVETLNGAIGKGSEKAAVESSNNSQSLSEKLLASQQAGVSLNMLSANMVNPNVAAALALFSGSSSISPGTAAYALFYQQLQQALLSGTGGNWAELAEL